MMTSCLCFIYIWKYRNSQRCNIKQEKYRCVYGFVLGFGIVLTEDDKCLQCFDLTFDVSVQCFLAPLTKGACVYTVPHDQIKYSYVYGLLEDQHLTFGAMAPSMLRYLKPYFGEINAPDMKYCILTGEASPIDLVHHWEKCVPKLRYIIFMALLKQLFTVLTIKLIKDGEVKTLMECSLLESR